MCSELYVPSLFEAHLDTWPEAIALYEGQQIIQYRVLNNYANALAAYLNVQHIGLGSIVGVCLTPSIALGIVFDASYACFVASVSRNRMAKQ